MFSPTCDENLSDEEVKNIIHSKLENDWMLLFGDLKDSMLIEKVMCEPCAERNDDFIVLIKPTPDGSLLIYHLIKKSERLKRFLEKDSLENVLSLEIIRVGDKTTLRFIFKQPGFSTSEIVDQILELYDVFGKRR